MKVCVVVCYKHVNSAHAQTLSSDETRKRLKSFHFWSAMTLK
jgi:hypothetical protein